MSEQPTAMPAAPAAEEYIPRAPLTLKEAGVNDSMVDILLMKYLFGAGTISGARIASFLGLRPNLLRDRLAFLKKEQLIRHEGVAELGDFNFALTENGRLRANQFFSENAYVGTVPVPLEQYIAGVRAQTITNEKPNLDKLKDAFSDLLINQKMFRTLGPAVNSGRGMFLYGFPGNGKTSIAERITRCFGNDVYIPRAIHSDGFIVKLFDAGVHVPVEEQASLARKAFKRPEGELLDERWVKVTRPTVIVGGELTMEQLEIQYNATSKTSEASVQLKSNLGTLVIDDFGRQKMPPIQLLNRWIVPLEKRFDYLALANGQMIKVPFDQLLIFSTNLEPKDLVDEAFLRRIPYKINVIDPSEDEYRQLFKIMCKITEVEHREDVVDYLVDEYYRKSDRPFRCCQPRDLLMLIKNQAQYVGESAVLTKDYVDFATSVYFTVL